MTESDLFLFLLINFDEVKMKLSRISVVFPIYDTMHSWICFVEKIFVFYISWSTIFTSELADKDQVLVQNCFQGNLLLFMSIYSAFYYTPAWKVSRGHIVVWSSVCPSVCLSHIPELQYLCPFKEGGGGLYAYRSVSLNLVSVGQRLCWSPTLCASDKNALPQKLQTWLVDSPWWVDYLY